MKTRGLDENILMLVRIIKEDEETLPKSDMVVVRKLHNAIEMEFKRDSNIIEFYEESCAQNLDNGTFLVNKNALITTSAILPSTIIDLIENYNIEPHLDHGIFLKWAIAHSSLSTIMYLLSKHKDSMTQYIDSAIIDGISNGVVPSTIFDYFIDHCEYDIHKNDEYLLTQCAMRKNYTMSRYLLERGANIPIGVYKAFRSNGKKFRVMWRLIREYRHLVIGGDI